MATITATTATIDATSAEGLTREALAMWQVIVQAAGAVGLDRINLQAGAGAGHLSHAHGTEIDIRGYNADGSLWTFEQRMGIAMAAAAVGANRFGFYTQGGSPTTLHVGLGHPSLPSNVAWGPGGRVRNVGINSFSLVERDFVAALREGVVRDFLASPEVMAYAASPPTPLAEGAIAAVNRVAATAPTLAGTIGAGIVLERGGQGAAVRELQAFLVDEGYTDAAGNELRIDGDFGPRTEHALQQYQIAQGLPGTGRAGVDTFNRIQADIAGEKVDAMPRFEAEPDFRVEPPEVVFERALRRGDEGDDVTQLQRLLNFLGFTGQDGSALTVDGVFGRNTMFAISEFQRSRGLTVDGVAGLQETLPALATIRMDEAMGVLPLPRRRPVPALPDLDLARLGGGGEPSLDRVRPTYPDDADMGRVEIYAGTDVPQRGYRSTMVANPYIGMTRQELEALDVRDLDANALRQVGLAYQELAARRRAGSQIGDLERQHQDENRSAWRETRETTGGGLITRQARPQTNPGGRWDLTTGNPDQTAPTHAKAEPPPFRITDLWRFYPNYSYNAHRRPPRLTIAADTVVNADPGLERRAAFMHWMLPLELNAEPRFLQAPQMYGEPRRVETTTVGPHGELIHEPPPPRAAPPGGGGLQQYQDAIDRANELLEEYRRPATPAPSLSLHVPAAQPRKGQDTLEWFGTVVAEATGTKMENLTTATTMFTAMAKAGARGAPVPPPPEPSKRKNRTPNLSRVAANGPKAPPTANLPDLSKRRMA